MKRQLFIVIAFLAASAAILAANFPQQAAPIQNQQRQNEQQVIDHPQRSPKQEQTYTSAQVEVDRRLKAVSLGKKSGLDEVAINFSDKQNFAEANNVFQSEKGIQTAVSNSRSSFQSYAIETDRSFRSAVVIWTTAEPLNSEEDRTLIDIKVRASKDGQYWTEWQSAELDTEGHNRGPNIELSTIVGFGKGHRFLQYSVELHTGPAGKVPVLEQIIVHLFVDHAQAKGDEEQTKEEESSVTSQEAATEESFLIQSTNTFLSRPNYVTRTQWGCPEGQSSTILQPRWTPQYTTVTHVVIHHTADSHTAPYSNWVKDIWNYHKYTKAWGDIGYNWLIDPAGVVYEGRAGGDNVIGAHFSCANSGTMGVALLGNFQRSDNKPAFTAAAFNALRRLLAWKAQQRDLRLFSQTRHSATNLNLFPVVGHKDGNATTVLGTCEKGTVCPGDSLYEQIPTLRKDITAIQDTDIRAKQAGYFNGIYEGTFGRDVNWDPNWELRWTGFTYQFNNQLFWSNIYEATSKTNPSVRMTGYYNYLGQWQPWQTAP